jgi:hypothetical protein
LPNITSKKLGLDRKIMLTSSITKWIFKEGNKVRLYIVCKVHSKYKRRRKEVEKIKFYTYKFAKKSKGSPNLSCFHVEANCSKPLKMKQTCDLHCNSLIMNLNLRWKPCQNQGNYESVSGNIWSWKGYHMIESSWV